MNTPRPTLEQLQILENKIKSLKPKERAAYIKSLEEEDVTQMLLREFGGKLID